MPKLSVDGDLFLQSVEVLELLVEEITKLRKMCEQNNNAPLLATLINQERALTAIRSGLVQSAEPEELSEGKH